MEDVSAELLGHFAADLYRLRNDESLNAVSLHECGGEESHNARADDETSGAVWDVEHFDAREATGRGFGHGRGLDIEGFGQFKSGAGGQCDVLGE